MCGVFGAFGLSKCNFTESDFIKATESASHRGPDNLGYFSDADCFLGHTRLSIVGLGESGNQPFRFEDLVMVYNGEVYNYRELKEELVEAGYEFEGSSDTEVVLKSFHKWGGECFSRFNGMWSLVIYDQKKKRLIASRDRFGQKPLFVMQEGSTLYFASEAQQLVRFSSKGIDYGLIQIFLKEGQYRGAGRTFFESIEIFPKAHYCEIDASNRCDSFRYWDYWDGDIGKVEDSCFEEFSDLLQDAVKLRLRTDVPFGVLLSGGVDSTIVAAYAERHDDSGNAIPAFTYSADDASDESSYAKSVAQKLGLEITIRKQEQDPQDYRDRLKRLVKHMGRGHSSPAIVSVDYLYESVADSGIKVALDGQGADELLGGYKSHFVVLISLFLLKGRLLQAIYYLADVRKYRLLRTFIMFMRLALPPWAKTIMRWLYGYERFFKRYKDTPRSSTVEAQVTKAGNKNALNRYLIRQHELGLDNLLFYGDAVAMKNSVENRSPFMDYRLVDFVFSRSEELKVWNGQDKFALRNLDVYETFREELDRKKVGFASDIRRSTKSFMVEELRSSPILEWPIFTKKLSAFVEGGGFESSKYERLLFRFYQVHLWNEEFRSKEDAI